MSTLGGLAGLSRAERSTGAPMHAPAVFEATFLSLAFEAEARAWGEENGVAIVGHGFAARPEQEMP